MGVKVRFRLASIHCCAQPVGSSEWGVSKAVTDTEGLFSSQCLPPGSMLPVAMLCACPWTWLFAQVHRGVYEAAQALYDRFHPMVEEHMASSPLAKIVFTGHSLGGSLATLLMLMYLHRRVLRPLQLSPTYTFGAPAIFCEGGVTSDCAAKVCPPHPYCNLHEWEDFLSLYLGTMRMPISECFGWPCSWRLQNQVPIFLSGFMRPLSFTS